MFGYLRMITGALAGRAGWLEPHCTALEARRSRNLPIRLLRNEVRQLVVVKPRGRVPREDLAEAGLPSAVEAPRCSAGVDVGQSGRARVALEIEEGLTFREIMATVDEVVTEAALARHGGRVADALKELSMTKGAWYRIRREG